MAVNSDLFGLVTHQYREQYVYSPVLQNLAHQSISAAWTPMGIPSWEVDGAAEAYGQLNVPRYLKGKFSTFWIDRSGGGKPISPTYEWSVGSPVTFGSNSLRLTYLREEQARLPRFRATQATISFRRRFRNYMIGSYDALMGEIDGYRNRLRIFNRLRPFEGELLRTFTGELVVETSIHLLNTPILELQRTETSIDNFGRSIIELRLTRIFPTTKGLVARRNHFLRHLGFDCRMYKGKSFIFFKDGPEEEIISTEPHRNLLIFRGVATYG